MIHLYQAIFALNPSIVIVRDDVAFDKDEKEVPYNKNAAQVKLAELQAAETAAEQAAIAAKESALSKLTAIGLTPDEIKALIG